MSRRLAGVGGFGGLLLIALLLFCTVGPLLVERGPTDIDVGLMFASPSTANPFGGDNYGRDVFVRTMYGVRISLLIGLLTTTATTVLGVFLGVLAGFFDSLDAVIGRLIDSMMVFPDVLIAIVLLAVLGGGVANVVLALSFVYSSRTARLVRALVLGIKSTTYVEAARAVGCSSLWVILRHVLPNMISGLLVNATFVFAYAILAEAALSFLGLGPPPPTPTLGNMIAEGQRYLRTAPWLVLFPGMLIASAVLSINVLGDRIRDKADPRSVSS